MRRFIWILIACLLLTGVALAESDADAVSAGEDVLFFSSTPAQAKEDKEEEVDWGDENGTPVLQVTLQAAEWSWEDARHTATLTVTNTGDGVAKDVVLVLSELKDGDRVLAQPVFWQKGGKNLGQRLQKADADLEVLHAGQSQEYTVTWVPSFDLIGVKTAAMTVTAACEGASTVTGSLTVERSQGRTGLWEAKLGPVSAGMAVCILGGLAALLAAGAVARKLIWKRKKAQAC